LGGGKENTDGEQENSHSRASFWAKLKKISEGVTTHLVITPSFLKLQE
jgi:hypothetical protein